MVSVVSSVKMEVSRTLLSVLAVFYVTIVFTEAHVALTFPPARKYDLDFLDNSRTKGPCGMPKGKNPFADNVLKYVSLTLSNKEDWL